MSLQFTNVNSYMQFALDSYIDHCIFFDIYKYYEKLSRNYILGPLAHNYIASRYSFILFGALSIESYVNLLGDSLLQNNFFENYLERLPVLKKLSVILEIKYNKKINLGVSPFQSIRILFKSRDKIVHDKSKVIKSVEDYHVQRIKRNLNINLKTTIKSFKLFNEEMKTLDPSILFLSGLNEDTINRWLRQRKYFYKVGNNLLFEHSSFPDVHDYICTVRRHTGFNPEKYSIDKIKQIISFDTNGI